MGVTFSAALGCAGVGCSGVDVDTECTPLYEPTFDNVYQNTLAVSCAVGNGTCHTSDASAGGLAFPDADSAYAALLDDRVEPGDASCSLIVERIASDGDDVMPPGSPLNETERCSIVQWIEAGAER